MPTSCPSQGAIPWWFPHADLRLLRTLQIALFQHFSLTSPDGFSDKSHGRRRNLPSKKRKSEITCDYARI